MGPMRSLPGLAKHTSTPAATAARSRRSAPEGGRSAAAAAVAAVIYGGVDHDCLEQMLWRGATIKQEKPQGAQRSAGSVEARPPFL